jgi:hypothetical protein
MQRSWLFILICIIFLNSVAQNVGTGTALPLTKLQIKGGLLLNSTIGNTPVSGAGTRLMWIPAKVSFRAGVVAGNNGDNINIGNFSVAAGHNTKASGTSANAFGDAVIAIGYSIISTSFAGFAMGSCNDTTDAVNTGNFNPLNRIFQMGNGPANNAGSNALTVLQNGHVGIGVLYPSQMLDVAGIVTVQNGKGIIRTTDGTQKKEWTTTVVVTSTLTAGARSAVNFTFPECFNSTPDVYAGNIVSGAGGWAEVIMSDTDITTTGGIQYINNPGTGNRSPNFALKIIAIGPP